jgi:hypothetical protein
MFLLSSSTGFFVATMSQHVTQYCLGSVARWHSDNHATTYTTLISTVRTSNSHKESGDYDSTTHKLSTRSTRCTWLHSEVEGNRDISLKYDGYCHCRPHLKRLQVLSFSIIVTVQVLFTRLANFDS